MAQNSTQRHSIINLLGRNLEKNGHISLLTLSTWNRNFKKENNRFINYKKSYELQRLNSLSRKATKEQKVQTRQILLFLNDEHRRCTYRAFGEAVGIYPIHVTSLLLGAPSTYTSWVVSSKTGQPNHHDGESTHLELEEFDIIIRDGEELNNLTMSYLKSCT